MKTPVDVVNAAFTALNCGDWAELASVCDPVSLRAFKREMLDQFPECEDGIQLDVDDLMESEPGLPREVAEYQLAKMNQYMDPTYRLKSQLYSVAGVDELRAMDPGRVFARWLQARSPEHFPRDEQEENEPWEPSAQDDSLKATRAYRYIVLGSVLDSAQVAYVVYRKSLEPTDAYPGLMDEWAEHRPADEVELARVTHFLHQPRVATCRRQTDGSWRLIADSSLMVVPTLQAVEIRRESDN